MKTRFIPLQILGILILAFATNLKAETLSVTAALDRAKIALGQSAQLSVTVSGGENIDPALPKVNGLEFTPAGQSSSFQSINGTVTTRMRVLYEVTPDRVGTFTIPPIRLPGGGSSQSLALQVLQRADLPSSNLLLPNARAGTGGDAEAADGEAAFLRITLAKHELYVGQLVPVQVKAYFRAGMSAALNGLPVLKSDAFTLSKLNDNPEQAQETIGGRPYTVLTWNSALEAVKAGGYQLNIELPVTVRVQTPHPRRPNPFKQFFGNSPFDDSMFDDSFFDNFFGGEVEKPLMLHMDSEKITVLPLPAFGRPADFSGAIGQFEVSSEAAPKRLALGDPVNLRLKVSGQGNFDRVASHGLETSAQWKTYQPSVHFEPADSAGDGIKTFEQAVLPLKAGAENIPALSFSYFDPDARQYVTRTTEPIAVEVSPGSGAPVAAKVPASPAIPSPAPLANPFSSELAPNQVETGHFVSSLRPVLFAPWFIAAQGVPTLALLGSLFLHRRRQRLAQDPRRIRAHAAETAVREQVKAMEQALAAERAPEFFTAACKAVRERLAQRWQLSGGQVTPAEINRRLNGDGKGLRNLFTVADAVVYSGQDVPPADLKRWKGFVIQQLKNLEQP